jgi:hypothetical protein
MVYLWNNHGGDLVFKGVDTFLSSGRAVYKGQSGTVGVEMFLVDGILYFTKDVL